MVSIANKTRNIAQFFSSFDGIARGGGWIGRARGNRMLEMRIRAVSKKRKEKKGKRKKKKKKKRFLETGKGMWQRGWSK